VGAEQSTTNDRNPTDNSKRPPSTPSHPHSYPELELSQMNMHN